MDISANLDDQALPVALASGRSPRIPDLRLLLTVHAARQDTTPTARAIREADLPVVLADEPSRLSLIFASNTPSPATLRRAAGSFNASVAAFMAVGTNGEGAVHSGG
ncbi:hypothetical protein M2337_000947 [Sphingobium sp. B2D3A]|uniref:hypothetical protein n=1 Tax=Sphingobium TaxID=165695 RepID=UPI0015EB9683|nr:MULTISPECIES: hypothetical protein [Sphingobium]MCW2336714.1 hypothetical protein [Sphingobium sp. B2D3A]MCW2349221.1 hypothetical protein [Sphingobium sp. B12D2B]MCW2363084.1 hypothetical protein [Sphingobium sp. B10D3B]MCW2368314.1 hypothetical protein [Sphingobium sp. B11D3D]MCW2382969.1 hypothetical protein [Sphingobium sp. B2D3B]